MIYAAPDLTSHDRSVLAEIHDMRRTLADVLRSPRRWTGGLRRTMLARAILGSNSIEPFRATSRSLSVIDGASKVGCPKSFLDGQGWPGAIVSGFIGVEK